MSDEVPDFPPGPRGPEEGEVPGARLRITADQLRFIGLYVERVQGAAVWVELEERGAGYFDLTVTDADGKKLAGRRVMPRNRDDWAQPDQ